MACVSPFSMMDPDTTPDGEVVMATMLRASLATVPTQDLVPALYWHSCYVFLQ
jgi:hypothetical protein